jgi:hypothetical protein
VAIPGRSSQEKTAPDGVVANFIVRQQRSSRGLEVLRGRRHRGVDIAEPRVHPEWVEHPSPPDAYRPPALPEWLCRCHSNPAMAMPRGLPRCRQITLHTALFVSLALWQCLRAHDIDQWMVPGRLSTMQRSLGVQRVHTANRWITSYRLNPRRADIGSTSFFAFVCTTHCVEFLPYFSFTARIVRSRI